jgi:pyrimidine-specific ribonucleoside hydrolase
MAVTAVFGNVGLETTAVNARRLLALAGRTDVPVAEGAARPLVYPQAQRAGRWHHADGLGGRAETLPPPGPLHPGGAVELLAAVLRAVDRPVTLASIGPMTNVALLLATHPELAGRIDRIVAMGGALRGGNTTASAEFNVHCDPEAAHRVLAEESVPVTLVPLDLTLRCAVPGSWLDELAASGPLCATLGGVIEHYRERFRAEHGVDGVPLHDAVAVLETALPGLLRTEPMSLRVVCAPAARRGTLRASADRTAAADRTAGGASRPVDVAVDADIPRVHAEILRRLRTLDGEAITGQVSSASPRSMA